MERRFETNGLKVSLLGTKVMVNSSITKDGLCNANLTHVVSAA